MPEHPNPRAVQAPRWLRSLFVVVAVLAVALGMSTDRHHADELAGSAPAAVAQVAADAGDAIAGFVTSEAAAIGGIAVVCAIVLLCCLAILRRALAVAALPSPGRAAARARPDVLRPLSISPAPRLEVLSISRT